MNLAKLPRWLRRARWRRLLIGGLLMGVVCYRLSHFLGPVPTATYRAPGPYYVKRVIDGDTLVLEGGGRIRLFGVDTPETKHPDRPAEPLGAEAARFTRRHVEGNRVRLQFDRERRDDYHRLLAYVFVGDWFLNEELIRAGYSRAETAFPYSSRMKRRFRAAEEAARQADRGLWAENASAMK